MERPPYGERAVIICGDVIRVLPYAGNQPTWNNFYLNPLTI